MIAALRGGVFEALKREEETLAMYERLSNESSDSVMKSFFSSLANDSKSDITTLKNLNLQSIIKFGLAIKFQVSRCEIDEMMVKSIKDIASAKENLKFAVDEINADIEYYDHVAEHSIFPELKRLFRILSDKELEHKCKIKALIDLIE